jgi:hypothetical protein
MGKDYFIVHVTLLIFTKVFYVDHCLCLDYKFIRVRGLKVYH